MPKLKSDKTPKFDNLKLAKNHKRGEAIKKSDKKIKDQRKAKAWLTYVELKMIKGHTKEQAQAMANEVVYNQKPV